MWKKMKKSPLVLLLVLVGGLAVALPNAPQVFKDEAEPLQSTSILYVYAADDCEVFVDGVSYGKAPALVSGLSTGTHSLLASAPMLVYRRTLDVSDAGGITRIQAVLHPPTGTLVVEAVPAGADVIIDGTEMGHTPLRLDGLVAGSYELLVTADRCEPLQRRIEIPADSVVRVTDVLGIGFALRLLPLPPNGAVLTVHADPPAEQRTYVFPALPLFAAGTQHFTVTAAGYQSFDFSVDPSDASAAPVRYDPVPALGFLHLVGMPNGSTVFLGGVATSLKADTQTLSAPPGLYTIRVVAPGFPPYIAMVSVEAGRTLDVNLNMIPSNIPPANVPTVAVVKRQATNPVKWLILALGGAVSVTSLVLNNDSVAMGVTSSYSGYTTMKYASIAGLGAGLAVSGVALYELLFK
jgi:hypothetical protein